MLITFGLGTSMKTPKYPLVPGHEFVGFVKEVGPAVNRFKAGDHVGVGTYVNSCRSCSYCEDRQESFCERKSTYTFNDIDVDGAVTKGGYSTLSMIDTATEDLTTTRWSWLLLLLCAGITVYAPMVRHRMNQPGKSLGVIGLGGLGHMAVQFGKALGLSVTVFSISISKRDEALAQLDADNFIVSSDQSK